MDEIVLLKQLGSALDEPKLDEAKLRVRAVVEREIDQMGGVRRHVRRRPNRARLLLIAAIVAAVLVGGIALAGGFTDGLGVDAPPGPKIPYVQDHIDQMEAELATLDTSTPEGAAKATALKDRLEALREVKARLCEEAGQPDGC